MDDDKRRKFVKKGKEYVGIVDRIDFPNKGIIKIEDEKAIVKNAVPGQKVRFVINKARKDKKEGRLLEVLEKSPLETEEPKCVHFGPCGGCTYQTIPYETQLDIKKNQVKSLIDAVCDDYVYEGIIGSPKRWEYRNKMEFSFGDEYKDGPLALGLHKKGSFHDIVTANKCQIVDKDYNQILSCVLNYYKELGTDFYHKLSHTGYLRHLLVRRGENTGEILVNLVTSSQWGMNGEKASESCENSLSELVNDNGSLDEKAADVCGRVLSEDEVLDGLKDRLLSLELNGKIVGILHIINDSLADVVQSDKTDILYGDEYFYEELLGLKFKISTFSFFQTNSLGAEVLYEKAREYVGATKDKLIFDLYSGTGTIAQLLAPVAKKVIGVEIVAEAVEAAKVNAALNGLINCEFIAGDVLKVIDEIEEKPDLIVLDPPRDGIHPKALDKIIDYGVDRLVYISCKPTSLARDLVILQEKGYKVERVCAVDMFPGTVHVETVILMTRCGKNDK
jgi:23S rRNA (uracil1939-C5)-methyltransferase